MSVPVQVNIPKTQRAWRYVRRGAPSVALEFDPAAPVSTDLAEGEVLVRVATAAVNPGFTVIMAELPTWFTKPPMVVLNDLSGTIVASRDTTRPVGTRVIGFLHVPLQFKTKEGAGQEYARMPGNYTVPLPNNLKFEEGAFAMTAMTAYQMLFVNYELKRGQRVFVNGATTAVGAFAVQIAKLWECEVWGSASGRNEELAKSFGVDVFLDYTKRPIHLQLADAELKQKFDLVFDATGEICTPLWTHCTAYLAPGGTFVTSMGGPPNLRLSGLAKVVQQLWQLRPVILGGVRRKWSFAAVTHKVEDLQQLADWMAEGKLKPYVDSVYPMEDLLKAIEKLMSRHTRGKVVVRICDDE